MERTAIDDADAVIAVPKETRNDVFDHFGSAEANTHAIHNGIDLNEYNSTEATDALERRGVDPKRPFVLFVGRITRQKGIIHAEMEEHVAKARQQRFGIIWVDEMVSRKEVIQFYSHATVRLIAKVNAAQPAGRRDWAGSEGADRTRPGYGHLRRAPAAMR